MTKVNQFSGKRVRREGAEYEHILLEVFNEHEPTDCDQVGMAFQELRILLNELRRTTVNPSPQKVAYWAALDELIDQNFQQSIELFSRLAREYPELEPEAELNIGVCYRYMHIYDSALDHLHRAKSLGHLPEVVEYNIREVQQLAQQAAQARANAER